MTLAIAIIVSLIIGFIVGYIESPEHKVYKENKYWKDLAKLNHDAYCQMTDNLQKLLADNCKLQFEKHLATREIEKMRNQAQTKKLPVEFYCKHCNCGFCGRIKFDLTV